jgi:hypothetical protein
MDAGPGRVVSDDLITWLRAQIDDDEQVALRFHLGRMPAEVALKRRLLEGHDAPVHRCAWGDFAIDDDCYMRRQIAEVYADRPGYREDWKP